MPPKKEQKKVKPGAAKGGKDYLPVDSKPPRDPLVPEEIEPKEIKWTFPLLPEKIFPVWPTDEELEVNSLRPYPPARKPTSASSPQPSPSRMIAS